MKREIKEKTIIDYFHDFMVYASFSRTTKYLNFSFDYC